MAIVAKVSKYTSSNRSTHAKTSPAGDEGRRHLKQALERNEVTPAALARNAGLPNANSIYNFLAGKTEGLSLRTMRKILPHLPKSNADVLLGVSQEDTELTRAKATDLGVPPLPKSLRNRSIKHLRDSTQNLKRGLAELHQTIGVWSQHIASIEARIDDLADQSEAGD